MSERKSCESWTCGNEEGIPGPCRSGFDIAMREAQDAPLKEARAYVELDRKVENAMREFDTGATRDADEGKLDYEGFLSPSVLTVFAEYMHSHRIQPDGTLRDSDNWQKGIPYDAYMKSGFRHFMEWWTLHREPDGGGSVEELTEALCALLFNVQGYLFELLKDA